MQVSSFKEGRAADMEQRTATQWIAHNSLTCSRVYPRGELGAASVPAHPDPAYSSARLLLLPPTLHTTPVAARSCLRTRPHLLYQVHQRYIRDEWSASADRRPLDATCAREPYRLFQLS